MPEAAKASCIETKCQPFSAGRGTVVHACNPSTWEVEAGGLEFEATLSYIVSSRLA
jgi:hypothetical protein